MPEDKKIATDEEIREIQNQTARNLRQARKLLAEAKELQKENARRVDDLVESTKYRSQKLREADLKYGFYTDPLDEYEIMKILREQFDAEYRGKTIVDWPEKGGLLEIDAVGLARKGVEAVYLVIVRELFKPTDIEYVLRQIELYRDIAFTHRQYALFPVVATEQIRDEDRQLVWDAGMYLINIDYRHLEFVEPPADFTPNGNHGLDGVRIVESEQPVDE